MTEWTARARSSRSSLLGNLYKSRETRLAEVDPATRLQGLSGRYFLQCDLSVQIRPWRLVSHTSSPFQRQGGRRARVEASKSTAQADHRVSLMSKNRCAPILWMAISCRLSTSCSLQVSGDLQKLRQACPFVRTSRWAISDRSSAMRSQSASPLLKN